MRPRIGRGTPAPEPEYQGRRLVDRAEVAGVEAAGRGTEALRIDHRRLLDQDAFGGHQSTIAGTETRRGRALAEVGPRSSC